MQRLISWKNAIFGCLKLDALQAEIIEKLVVERAEMLLPVKRERPPVFASAHAPSGSEWEQLTKQA